MRISDLSSDVCSSDLVLPSCQDVTMARLPGLQTATLVSLFALAATPAAFGQTAGQTADTPAAATGPAVLPALKVEGQAPAEFADGPVDGFRATRPATGTKTDTNSEERRGGKEGVSTC